MPRTHFRIRRTHTHFRTRTRFCIRTRFRTRFSIRTRFRFLHTLALSLISIPILFAQTTITPSRPFPQHTCYAIGSILPNHLTRRQMDDSVRAFYTAWKQRYIRNAPPAQTSSGTGNSATPPISATPIFTVSETQSYVWTEGAPGHTQSLSEGQGYGMMIVALMAGADQTAKSTYDGLFRYCRAHPSRNHPFLMAWAQYKNLNDRDGSSATDGDLDIAASLLLADAQWGSAGEIDYHKEALQTINAILRQEINPQTFSVLLSNDVEHDSRDYFDMRSSDFMPDHFRAFEKASRESSPSEPSPTKRSPTGLSPSEPSPAKLSPSEPSASELFAVNPWRKALDKNYTLFAFLQDHYSPEAGLFPDFIQHITDPENPSRATGTPQRHPAPQKAVPAHPHYLESRFDGMYNYNACRNPWRIATDYLLNDDPRAKKILEKINRWIRETSRNDPDNISAGYTLAGDDLPTRHFEALSFIAPFATAAMAEASHQEWLNKLWDYLMGFRLTAFDYYDNSIKMIDLILLSGNYWNP